DRVFGGHVGGRAGEADHAGDGGGVDNRAAAGFQEGGNLILHGEKHAPDVDGQDLVEGLGGGLGQALAQLLDARVVERHSGPAVGGDCPAAERGHLRFVGYVGADEESLAARLFDLGHDLLAFGFTAASQGDLRTFAREGHGGGAADTTGGAGDERD